MRVIDSRLDRLRSLRLRRCLGSGNWLRKDILNVRIAFHSLHVRSSRQRFRDLATPFHQNRIHNVERTMLDSALTQPLEDGPLLSGSYSTMQRARSGLFHSWSPKPLPGASWLG